MVCGNDEAAGRPETGAGKRTADDRLAKRRTPPAADAPPDREDWEKENRNGLPAA